MSAKLGTLTLDLVTRIGNFVGPIKKSKKQVTVHIPVQKADVPAYSETKIRNGQR